MLLAHEISHEPSQDLSGGNIPLSTSLDEFFTQFPLNADTHSGIFF